MNSFAIFVFVFFAANGNVQTVPSCQLSFQFNKVCTFYNFYQKTCSPWDLTTCRKVKTTLHEHKCPIYTCVRIILLICFLQPKWSDTEKRYIRYLVILSQTHGKSRLLINTRNITIRK